MNIQSVAIASGTEAGPAETMVKAAASAEETEDAALAAVTEIAETTEAPAPVRIEDAAEVTAVKTEENGIAQAKTSLSAIVKWKTGMEVLSSAVKYLADIATYMLKAA